MSTENPRKAEPTWARALGALLIAMTTTINASAATVAACKAPTTVSSGKTRAVVAELYSSEGCDSCPPADKWFATQGVGASSAVIPLAFHVDYWDYIGWKDRFATPQYSERQREQVRLANKHQVYTPQLMVNGRDVGYWHDPARIGAAQRDARASAAVATIDLSISPVPPMHADTARVNVDIGVTFDSAAVRTDSALYLAVTENNLVSKVTAGENRGVTLAHDHVVRNLIGPIVIRTDGRATITRAIDLAPDWKRADLQLVAFVQDRKQGEILQAIASPLCLK